MSRPALYYYFSSKEDILIRLVAGLIESSESALTAIREAAGGDVEERLQVAVCSLLGPILEAPGRFRLLLTHEAELPEPLATEYPAVRRKIVKEVRKIVVAGMESGRFRATDDRIATFNILGMCNWVAWWREDGRAPTQEAVGAEITSMALAGLRADGSAKRSDSPADSFEVIRAELSRLERSMGNGETE